MRDKTIPRDLGREWTEGGFPWTGRHHHQRKPNTNREEVKTAVGPTVPARGWDLRRPMRLSDGQIIRLSCGVAGGGDAC